MGNASQLTEMLHHPREEETLDDLIVEGEIPTSISGVYWLNGPARFRKEDQHWLDGDGMIRELTLKNGRASFRSRYVKTARFLEEANHGSSVYHRFGTLVPEGKMRRGIALESPANVSVYPFAGCLFAFGEQSLPYRMDRASLDTLGECNFNKSLIDITPLSAHPKIDEAQKRLCTFGIKYRMGWASLVYYEFERSLDCVYKAESRLEYCHSLHDFALSEHYACFYLSPYTLDIDAFRKQHKPLAHCLTWGDSASSRLLIQHRSLPDVQFSILLNESYYCLHTLNALESAGNDFLYVDLLLAEKAYYDQYEPLNKLFHHIGPTTVKRWKINVKTQRIEEETEIALPLHVDFPALRPEDSSRHYSRFWALAMSVEPRGEMKFYRQLIGFDWGQKGIVDSWTTEKGAFLAGEPSLIAAEDDSQALWVICQGYDTDEMKSYYLLFDALDLQRGPVAKIQLPVPDAPAFHSVFVADASNPG